MRKKVKHPQSSSQGRGRVKSQKTRDEEVLALVGRSDYLPMNAETLARRLRIPRAEFQAFERTLKTLERAGRLARVRRDRYAMPEDASLVPGRILIRRNGGGVLQSDDPRHGRIELAADATGTAMHLDHVLVRVEPDGRRAGNRSGQGLRGKVMRILDRARSTVVGTLQRSRQFFFVIPDDPRIPHDVYVTLPKGKRAAPRVGDKVVVDLKEWISRHNNPEGHIIEVLGRPEETEVDIVSIMRQYDLRPEFPEPVVTEAGRVGNGVAEADLRGRRDCRGDHVITIDPDDAKDFDDAFCLKRANRNEWKLWVHIADVSHYVKAGSAMDVEARRRGNSTYLVDRVIPMLPEQLSNELCSLKPNADRLTKCVEFVLRDDGKVLRTEYYSAVIHSRRRFTYREALEVLQRRPSTDEERMLVSANRLAQRIRAHRMKSGSLDLDFQETKIRLDEKGRLARVDKVENDVSHQLIEEFMLLANEAVAARLKAQGRVTVYRIHEPPSPERLEEYREELKAYGVRCGNLSKTSEVQALLSKLKTHPAGGALRIGFLRSLNRARYAIEPIGHYGLAKRNYAHFTSPIRRYADLVVHRSMFENIALSRPATAQAADHLSFTERNSADAEQDSKTVKLLAHLEAQLESGRLETYVALVTEVRPFGFFVELPDLGISGAVRVSTLEDDFYDFQPSRRLLRGRRTGREIAPGIEVKVRAATVDRFKRQANFALLRDRGSKRRR